MRFSVHWLAVILPLHGLAAASGTLSLFCSAVCKRA
jgi:hypothetical protein